MTCISLKRGSAILIYSCLLFLETVKCEGVHMKLHGQPSTGGDRNSSNDTALASSSVKDGGGGSGGGGGGGGCGESWCSSLNENELLALEAIRSLHRQIDDDQNGNIDFDESDEFLREELKYEGDYEKRQKLFHQDDDKDNHISVKELYESWARSEVHNWTVSQTVDWLSLFVGLPQYSQNFLDNSVNGSFLPRLAINHHQVLSSTVGIKDLIHKQKIALKAQDVVLFGSPKDYSNRIKDSILTTLLALALIVCWFVYSRYKLSQRDLNKMIKDMESLAKAEQALMDLQKELEKARTAQQEKAVEAGFQRKLLDDGIPCSEEIIRLKGEVEVLRNELQRAEVELQDKCWVPPPALQHWLQLTYELELKSYNKKKQAAEKQLKQAKDACDKLKKKRSSLMGAFVSTHGRSIDDVDKAILEARTALTEITQELQERMQRWKQIEILVNCPIMNNPGLQYLETILRGIGRGTSYGPGSVISNSQDDIDDDGASSIYCPSAVSKLVSTSMCLMYPGHDTTPFRLLPSHSEEPASEGYSKKSQNNPSLPSNSSAFHNMKPSSVDSGTLDSTVSAPGGTGSGMLHMPIMRSKSVSSMISLRERAMSRECSSKESSTGEEEVSTETSSEMMTSGRDRRVTFGIRTDHREFIATLHQPRLLNKEKDEEGKAVESFTTLMKAVPARVPTSAIIVAPATAITTTTTTMAPEVAVPAPLTVAAPTILDPARVPTITPPVPVVHTDGTGKKRNVKIWKVLSKTLRPIKPYKLSVDPAIRQNSENNGNGIVGSNHHHHRRHHSQDQKPEPALLTWSRRHLLRSSWKIQSHEKDRILLPAHDT